MNTMVKLSDADQLASSTQSTDRKRKLWLMGLVIPNIGNVAFLAYQFGPRSARKWLAWTGPLALHLIIPAIDKWMGEDADNPTDDEISLLEQDPYYAKVVKAFIPLQYIANFYGLYLVNREDTPWLHRILFGHLLGILNGVAVNTAHELSHKPTQLDHYLSHLCLLPTGYNHFRVEHPYGHHRRVATPEDPASAQLGESFWQFWPRTVIGSFKSAVAIETRRLKRKGKPFWSIENELLQGWGMSALYHAAMLKMFGKRIIVTQAVQAFCGITLFEIVNYMEHYGLKREQNADGQYVRTQPEHSWNNNSLFSNVLLYQLQRHSDHHAYSTRSYQSLRHHDHVPQLPAGYASMVLPAMIPKWWFKLMDHRVIEHYQGDLTRANLYSGASHRFRHTEPAIIRRMAE